MAKQTQQAPPEDDFVSIKLDTFTGGAQLQDGTYLLKTHTYESFDYGGKANATLAMKLVAQIGSVDAKGQFVPDGGDLEQQYSVGSGALEAFAISPSLTQLIPTGQKRSLGRGSNFFVYLENIVGAGFPEDRFDNDISAFDGCVVKITNIPAPDRSNLPQSNLLPGAQPRNTPRTIPVPSDVLKLPWEKVCRKPGAPPAKVAAPATKAAPAPAAKAVEAETPATTNGDNSPDDLLTTYLAAVLSGNAKLPKSQARVGVFKAMNTAGIATAERDAAMKIFNDVDALGAVLMGVGEGYALEGADIVAVG